jgi:DNA invertase Pin-like site-specific DNA recombinase
MEYERVTVGRVLIDEDQSGGTQDRPGLDAARDRALQGLTQGFAVYNISRFSRFTEGGLADIRKLRERGARIAFVQERLDTSADYGDMVLTILLAVHAEALRQIKAGWKVVKARAIKECRQIGPTPPGYVRTTVKNGRPKGSLAPDGERGEAITDAYHAVAAEEDIRAALPTLRGAFPTTTFTARKRETAGRYGVKVGEEVTIPATWNTTTARRLLQSRVYLGEAFYGDEVDVNPHAHPALIDGVTWRRVQKVIGVPADMRRAPAEDFPLSDAHAVCATCGFPLIGGRAGTDPRTRHGRRAYICNTNKRRDESTCQRPARIMAAPLRTTSATCSWTTPATCPRPRRRLGRCSPS